MNYIRAENHRKLAELNGDLLSFYVGIIWYCFTGAFGIDLYRWNWLGIKSVVPSDMRKYVLKEIENQTPKIPVMDLNFPLVSGIIIYF